MLAVIAYHFGLPGITGGFIGVDVFFVISGFLITSQIQSALQQGRFSFQTFYVSRLRRIFPALAFVCVTSLAWGWFYVLPYDYRSFSRHALAALFFVSNIAFTGEQSYFDIAAHSKPLLHSWSLSIEGQLYLFLPLYLYLIWRFCSKRIVLGLAAASLASLAWCLFETNQVNVFYLLTGRAWEFLAGGLLSCAPRLKFSKNWANVIGLFAITALVFSCLFLNASLLWPSLLTLIPVSAVIALLMVPNAPVLKRALMFWPIQRLGDLSYSLYLWHWPVLVHARQYALSVDQTLSPAQLIGLLLLTLILAALTWQYIEQPIRQRRAWWSNKRVVFGVGFVIFLCMAFTLTIVASQGLAQRFPNYVQRAFSAIAVATPRQECFRDAQSHKKAVEQFCTLDDDKNTNIPEILLWGDSHANQYVSALAQATRLNGSAGVIATQSDCRPTITGTPADLMPEHRSDCEKFNREVNKFIVQTPSVKTVILGRLWRSGTSFDSTVALTKSLVKSGKKVFLVGPLPVPGFHVPEHWSQLQLRTGHGIDNLTVTLNSQNSSLQIMMLLRTQLAAEVKSGNLILIDPFKTLCDAKLCYLVKNGVSNYGDISHLSKTGSLLFTTEFAAALDTLVHVSDLFPLKQLMD